MYGIHHLPMWISMKRFNNTIHLAVKDFFLKKRFQQERSKGRNKGTDQPEHLDKNKDYALTSN
jgi:hypothetical protein